MPRSAGRAPGRTRPRRAEAAALRGPVFLFIDEVHLLPDWASRLKGEWDRLRRRRVPIHVVATGSSAAYVRDAIVEPAIGRDLMALAPVRKPALLRQVFGVAIASPAQIVSLQKIQGQLQERGALETVAHYLSLLEEAYLVAALPRHSRRLGRRRAAPPKLVALNNALLAVADPQGPPEPSRDPARFGAWVENACLAAAWNAGQQVAYWREEPLEVDGVIEGSWGRWAVEIKTGSVTPADLRGLLEFTRATPAYQPLLICESGTRLAGERAGIHTIEWRDFLLSGPAASRPAG